MGLLKKLKKAKGKVTSFRGDANALKSKFGIGRSLSNKFDQRISDSFSDLLGGILGVRTSNIPDIGGEVDAARQDRRQKRIDAVSGSEQAKSRSRDAPAGSAVLVFPRSYFNEKGEVTKTSSSGKTGAFPNSIHFRSLKRKKFDASEGG